MAMELKGLADASMHVSLLCIQLVLILYIPNCEARVLKLPSEEGIQNVKQHFKPENSKTSLNSRPLIGVLTQPGDGDGHIIINSLPPSDPRRSNMSYIAASYVKFIEAGGARAVPLIYNEPEESLAKKFAAINGILFTGGGSSLQAGPFYNTAEKLFKMALKANDKGDYFPVFGTCLGFELISVIVSQDHGVLETFKALGQPGPLIFANDLAKRQSMFSWFPEDILEEITHKNLAMENHMKGISPGKWASIKPLVDFFEVLTTTPDQQNKPYVSTVQGRKYPVTGVQWHPEKNAYEWGIPTIPHSSEAIQVTQNVANFLVSEARKSSHMPSSLDEENQLLIYNYSPIFSGQNGFGFFEQSYAFW